MEIVFTTRTKGENQMIFDDEMTNMPEEGSEESTDETSEDEGSMDESSDDEGSGESM